MKKNIKFLGIETSCDETAAAVIQENEDGSAKILSNVVSSQIKEHEKFGGVVPELAARAHIENIDFIIKKALTDSKSEISELDGIRFIRDGRRHAAAAADCFEKIASAEDDKSAK